MEEERVSYETLQDLLRQERRGNKPTPLPPRFWPDVRAFLDEAHARFRDEQAKDPFSRKAMLSRDETQNARHAAQALWALRERKLAMMALAHTHERQRPGGITPDEGALYDRLLEVLDASRTHALGQGAPKPVAPAVRPVEGAPTAAPAGFATPAMPTDGAAPVGPPAPAASAVAPPVAPPAIPPVAAVVPAPPPPAPGPTAPPTVPADVAGEEPLVTIRALGDIPPFVGPDMQTYILKTGDVATVPPSIARLLERRQKAVVVAI